MNFEKLEKKTSQAVFFGILFLLVLGIAMIPVAILIHMINVNFIVMMQFFFALAILWRWIGEATTEGYTWANRIDRMNNKFIKPGIHDDPNYKDAKGAFSYHTWRAAAEDFGIVCMVIFESTLAIFMVLVYGLNPGTIYVGILKIVGIFLGVSGIGIFIYERIFNYINYDKLFPKKGTWDVFNGRFQIPRKPWHDWAILTLGVVLTTISW